MSVPVNVKARTELVEAENYAKVNLGLLEGRKFIIVSRSKDNTLQILRSDSKFWSGCQKLYARIFIGKVYEGDAAKKEVINDSVQKLTDAMKHASDYLLNRDIKANKANKAKELADTEDESHVCGHEIIEKAIGVIKKLNEPAGSILSNGLEALDEFIRAENKIAKHIEKMDQLKQGNWIDSKSGKWIDSCLQLKDLLAPPAPPPKPARAPAPTSASATPPARSRARARVPAPASLPTPARAPASAPARATAAPEYLRKQYQKDLDGNIAKIWKDIDGKIEDFNEEYNRVIEVSDSFTRVKGLVELSKKRENLYKLILSQKQKLDQIEPGKCDQYTALIYQDINKIKNGISKNLEATYTKVKGNLEGKADTKIQEQKTKLLELQQRNKELMDVYIKQIDKVSKDSINILEVTATLIRMTGNKQSNDPRLESLKEAQTAFSSSINNLNRAYQSFINLKIEEFDDSKLEEIKRFTQEVKDCSKRLNDARVFMANDMSNEQNQDQIDKLQEVFYQQHDNFIQHCIELEGLFDSQIIGTRAGVAVADPKTWYDIAHQIRECNLYIKTYGKREEERLCSEWYQKMESLISRIGETAVEDWGKEVDEGLQQVQREKWFIEGYST